MMKMMKMIKMNGMRNWKMEYWDSEPREPGYWITSLVCSIVVYYVDCTTRTRSERSGRSENYNQQHGPYRSGVPIEFKLPVRVICISFILCIYILDGHVTAASLSVVP